MRTAETQYSAALELYRTTSLSVKEICEQTGTRINGFQKYLQRYHRDLMYIRHGVNLTSTEASSSRMKKQSGQTPTAHAKYRLAIEACDNMDYIQYNVSEIARCFDVNPTGLCNQLRNHFPDIVERRERLRRRLGVADNHARGVRSQAVDQYAAAVEHLRATTDTLEQTAERFGVSYTGLRQHLIFYHKELVYERRERRHRAMGSKTPDAITGNGKLHSPTPKQTKRYAKAVELIRTTSLTLKDIAITTGVSLQGLRNYLNTWHSGLTKSRPRPAATKYSSAITILLNSKRSVAEVAKELNLNPDILRQYLKKNHPNIIATRGMKLSTDGRRMSTPSAAKYADAVELIATSSEPLKSIAERLGLNYKSLSSYIRRNYPNLR